MRVLKLLVLGVLLVLTTLCLGLVGSVAQDTREVLHLRRATQPDFVAPTPLASVPLASVPVASPLKPPEAPAWTVPEAAPRPKEPQFRRVRSNVQTGHRPVATQVAPALAPLPLLPNRQFVPLRPEDAIRIGLRHERWALELCYAQELRNHASFDGFVVVSVSLSANGRVTEAHVEEGTPRDARVGACIAARLRHLQLPGLTEEADLLIPIQLQANEPT